MSSGAKKHIRDNKICQCTVAHIYRVTPECSAATTLAFFLSVDAKHDVYFNIPSPSLISLVVSVDVKQHVYL